MVPKRKARRTKDLVKRVRKSRNPIPQVRKKRLIKVVFVCFSGVVLSPRYAYLLGEFLKEKKTANWFEIKTTDYGAPEKGPYNKDLIKNADYVFCLAPPHIARF